MPIPAGIGPGRRSKFEYKFIRKEHDGGASFQDSPVPLRLINEGLGDLAESDPNRQATIGRAGSEKHTFSSS